ncbi:hypothetical protein [Ancylobacter radicis]|uniref:Uncharacterized protein n=1 Tax=Ancylobacter radicis TaxID=2836179 RepID=A0ABS5RD44_9HYPH|nr:hypothetical protein [Ancylobacter radicis]MBS9478997.1 hypothetical protein [Ancylobacter radicis]
MSPPDDADRAARLAAALRENLKRRKVQAKGRTVPDTARGDAATDTSSAPPVSPSRDTTGETG